MVWNISPQSLPLCVEKVASSWQSLLSESGARCRVGAVTNSREQKSDLQGPPLFLRSCVPSASVWAAQQKWGMLLPWCLVQSWIISLVLSSKSHFSHHSFTETLYPVQILPFPNTISETWYPVHPIQMLTFLITLTEAWFSVQMLTFLVTPYWSLVPSSNAHLLHHSSWSLVPSSKAFFRVVLMPCLQAILFPFELITALSLIDLKKTRIMCSVTLLISVSIYDSLDTFHLKEATEKSLDRSMSLH